MRLIDADEIGLTDFEIVMCNGDYKEALKMLLDKISNQPTAYSVDNVVEELKERSKEYNSGLRLHGKPEEMRTDEAIEIVKRGGVADDVCEWESNYGFVSDKYKRETGCGYTFYDLHHAVPFKYCPHCGKKIKVVE